MSNNMEKHQMLWPEARSIPIVRTPLTSDGGVDAEKISWIQLGKWLSVGDISGKWHGEQQWVQEQRTAQLLEDQKDLEGHVQVFGHYLGAATVF